MDYLELMIMIDKLNKMLNELKHIIENYDDLDDTDQMVEDFFISNKIGEIEEHIFDIKRHFKKNLKDIKRVADDEEYFMLRRGIDEAERLIFELKNQW